MYQVVYKNASQKQAEELDDELKSKFDRLVELLETNQPLHGEFVNHSAFKRKFRGGELHHCHLVHGETVVFWLTPGPRAPKQITILKIMDHPGATYKAPLAAVWHSLAAAFR